MNVLRVDHTGIAVENMDEALAHYQRVYGVGVTERVHVPDQRVEVAFLALGDTQLELVCPTTSDSGVARFLARRGPGLHHVAVQVADIAAELNDLHQQGVELIDRRPRAGAHGLVAFVHPRGNGGVLLELVQNVRDQELSG